MKDEIDGSRRFGNSETFGIAADGSSRAYEDPCYCSETRQGQDEEVMFQRTSSFRLHPSSLLFGEVQEWLNWQHWKCCERETVPWVRIPPSPPETLLISD